jgi:hypothetical protein
LFLSLLRIGHWPSVLPATTHQPPPISWLLVFFLVLRKACLVLVLVFRYGLRLRPWPWSWSWVLGFDFAGGLRTALRLRLVGRWSWSVSSVHRTRGAVFCVLFICIYMH